MIGFNINLTNLWWEYKREEGREGGREGGRELGREERKRREEILRDYCIEKCNKCILNY